MNWPFALWLCVVLSVNLWVRRYKGEQAGRLFHRWAAAHAWVVVEARQAWLWRGRYTWASKGYVVFRVVLADADGTRRTGWARVGRWWDILQVSDEVEVELDWPALTSPSR